LPSVKFKSAKVQNQFNKEIKSRILADLGRAKGGGPLVKRYDDHLRKVNDKVMDEAAAKIQVLAADRYGKGLDDVSDALSTGIRGTVAGGTLQARKRFKGIQLKDWQALSKKYYKYKRREYSSTASAFWKRSGKTHAAFRAFAAGHKSGVSRSKNTVKLTNIGFKNNRRIYRYRIDFRFPSPTRGGEFFDAIFLKSFFQQKEFAMSGQSAGGSLDILGYLEGVSTSSVHRPFISRLMASRGKRFNKELLTMLNRFTARNSTK